MREVYVFNFKKYRNKISFFVKFILLISLFYASYFHLWHVLVANTLLLILVSMPYFLKNLEVKVPPEIELVVFLFVFISFFLGEFRGFVIQLFFGFALGFFGFATMFILYSNSKLRTNYYFIFIFSLSLSLAIGLGVEMAKFYLKNYLGYEILVLEYYYTMRSLLILFIGSACSLIIGYFYMQDYRPKLMSKFVSKFKKTNSHLFAMQIDSPEELLLIIKEGERENIEFKETLRFNLYSKQIDKRIEYSVLKTIVGFLNTDGGTLLIGVDDSGKINGIERDCFQNNDKFGLHFTNLVKSNIGREFFKFINFQFVLIEGKYVFKVNCLKGNKPVFLKGDQEEFFIRTGPATVKLEGKELLDYVKSRFD